MNRPLSLEVNGMPVEVRVEPRTSLGDMLRDTQQLTGLHLACEHGVCGACNVYQDGTLIRSCTTLAASCEGSQIDTIEAFDNDPVMAALREAFSREHALQCGYCTPGMMMAARDLVLRHPFADETLVRKEMSGNLCRCTGYAGIVKAVMSVAGQGIGAALAEQADTDGPAARWALLRARQAIATAAVVDGVLATPGDVGAAGGTGIDAGMDAGAAVTTTAATTAATTVAAAAGPVRKDHSVAPDLADVTDADQADMTKLERSFTLPVPEEAVRAFFRDLPRVGACMPGMSIDALGNDGSLAGTFTVKMGPIRAAFATQARIDSDPEGRSGRVISQGLDRITQSRSISRLDYTVQADPAGTGALVSILASFRISGRLAEFSRSDVVTALVDQLTARFADNVVRRLTRDEASTGDAAPADDAGGELRIDVVTLLRDLVKRRWAALVRLLRGRPS